MSSETKYCNYCGKEVNKEAVVCTHCGRQLEGTSQKNEETKKCKKCKELINKNSKKCPHCGANQKMPVWAIVLIVIVAIAIIGGTANNSNSNSDNGQNNNTTNDTNNNTSKPIEYIKVSKDDLDEALDNNAALARETYNGKYLEITGKLGTIDSELKYISLYSNTKKYDFVGIHCKVKNNEQKEIIKTLVKDQEITVKGKITDVGEVLGYYLDITEIVAN